MKGVFASQDIRWLIKEGRIKTTSGSSIPEDDIQPASLDIQVGEGEIVRLPGRYLPTSKDVLAEAKDLSRAYNIVYGSPKLERGKTFMLEVGEAYLVPLDLVLDLPDNVQARANAKSSSGRSNLHIRLLVNSPEEFDHVPDGYKGPLFAVVVAESFPVHIAPGDRFNQLRFCTHSFLDSRLAKYELQVLHENHGLIFHGGKKVPWDKVHCKSDTIILTADLAEHDGSGNPVAYRYSGSGGTRGLTFGAPKGTVPWEHFFEPISAPKPGEYLSLSKGGFYIISSVEGFRVPSEYCSEMVAYVAGIGEFRSHEAGFFDPGWGCGKVLGDTATLEVIPYRDILIKQGTPICAMELYHMKETPDKLYGQSIASNYSGQRGARLGKQFTSPIKG